VDALNRLQAETAAELDALSPSILDKAFKGEIRIYATKKQSAQRIRRPNHVTAAGNSINPAAD
jgi:hypothetical protein